ncbi:MAG: DUF87 domain-containing protein, partial [Betaproteobacteria bacterium]|nr:DUF87 domain-containing protein [Betaproteobacteria bacterium]
MASRITRSAARASSRRADRRAQAAEGGGTATEISGLGAELRWLGYGLFSIWIFLSLLSWSPEDAGWFQQGSRQVPTNWLGRFGAWTADSLLFGFGFSAGWFVVLSAALAYASWRFASPISFMPGGVLGSVVGSFGDWALGAIGLTLLSLAMIVAGLALFFRFSWLDVTEWVGQKAEALFGLARNQLAERQDRRLGESAAIERADALEEKRRQREVDQALEIKPVATPEPSKKAIEARQREKQRSLFSEVAPVGGLPAISLLDEVAAQADTISPEALEFTSRVIESRLADFGVQVKVVTAQPGPVITRYEIDPALGVKGSQIVNLAKDLARALSLVSIRVVETIPGKSLMGLELPNPRRQVVRLSEIIGSTTFQESHGVLPLALGKDIAGAPVVVDLARMPHLLVAGTTGSGKSVGVNAMLLSLLYRSTPAQVRLIMIDPKMLELSIYEGIP